MARHREPHTIETDHGPVDSREATTAEAGQLGGKRTVQLVEEGRLYEEEHANDKRTPPPAPPASRRR